MRASLFSSCVIAVMALFLVADAVTQRASADEAGGITILTPGEMEWGPAPAPFPEGALGAFLYGDPGKPGPFTLRFKMPAGYTIPAHWHSGSERVTVLKGTFRFAPGSDMDEDAMGEYGPGSYVSIPGHAVHYAAAGDEETWVQVDGDGPFDIHFVKPDGSEIVLKEGERIE